MVVVVARQCRCRCHRCLFRLRSPDASSRGCVVCWPRAAVSQEVLEGFQYDLMPNRVCEYVYRVAVKFAEFFRDCRCIGSPEQSSRLLLCLATRNVLRTSFELLGIDPVNRL